MIQQLNYGLMGCESSGSETNGGESNGADFAELALFDPVTASE